MKQKNFLSLEDFEKSEIEELIKLSFKYKKDRRKLKILKGKTVALVFQKPSIRTRVTFEVGIHRLGGVSICLGHQEVQLGKRETVPDIARVLSRYVNGIIARTFSHEILLQMAEYSSVPVINALSDLLHPCQILADLMTIQEKLGQLKNINLVYVGDGNNIANTWLIGGAKMNLNITIVTPPAYKPDQEILAYAKEISKGASTVKLCEVPEEVISEADVLYTDVWTSMGQEKETEERKKAFSGFQLSQDLVKLAKKDVLIMHCLPAHRGEEITDEVIESKNSIVFDQAENRLYTGEAILTYLLQDR
ncbi:ornithine carbamoyltransferase, partial [bacterium]|nr:ornithine carbamoyltransferase [bacterium]MBU1782619.1 ornithine carbamoyltransferase [bacterium]